MIIMTGRLICTTGTLARPPAAQFLEEIADTGHEAGLRVRPAVGNSCGRRQSSRCTERSLHGRGIYVAVKNHRRAHANLADQKDGLRAGVGWRRWRIRVKAEWRHDDGIYGFLREGWWSRGIRFVRIRLPWVAKGGNLSRGRRKRAFHTRAREIAGTSGGVAAKRFNLAA